MNNKITALLMMASIIFFGACSKTDTVTEPVTTITSSVAGSVIDLNNIPVVGATVTAGAISTTTNNNGEFIIKNAVLDKVDGFVKVSKSGYFNGSRTFLPRPNTVNNVKIKLIPKITTGKFSGASGGSTGVTGGGAVTVDPGSIVNAATGMEYTQMVAVSGSFLDPGDENFKDVMPGDLRGKDGSNKEGILRPYSMVLIELNIDHTNTKLQLANGKTATIILPIPAGMLGGAPTTIPLWYFDESTGIWKNEGNATKSGTNYIGTVAHFSFWTAAELIDNIRLDVSFKDSSGNTFANKLVSVTSTNYGSKSIYTDSSGAASGLVPANENLLLELFNDCGKSIYSKHVGPFSTDTDLGNIAIEGEACGAPVADFTYISEDIYIPVTIIFTNNSNNASSYLWDFGDGVTSVQQNPLHTYLSPGDYTVSLTATGPSGSDIQTITIPIADLPTDNDSIILTLNGVNYTWLNSDGLAGIRIDSITHFETYIKGGSTSSRYFSGHFSSSVPGNFLFNLYTVIDGTAFNTSYPGNAPTTTITEYGDIGGYITGTASGWIKVSPPADDSVTFSCRFRVVRTE